MFVINPQEEFDYSPIYLRAEAHYEDYNRFAKWFSYLPFKLSRRLLKSFCVPGISFPEDNIVVYDQVRLYEWYFVLHKFLSSRSTFRSQMLCWNMSNDYKTLIFNSIVTSKV